MHAGRLIAELINIYMIVLIVRCVLSFFPHSRHHPAVQFLHRITDPVLRPVQQILPPIGGSLDISPLVVLLLLGWIKSLFWRM